MPRGKKWPAEFKAKVVLETMTEDRTIAQVAGDHGLNPNLVSRWRAEFVDHADRVFAAESEKADRERELAEHKEEVDDLHRMTGASHRRARPSSTPRACALRHRPRSRGKA